MGRPRKPKKSMVEEYPDPTVELDDDDDQMKPCVACIHNIRIRRKGNPADTVCRCEIDWHYIGYVQNFVQSCEHWERDFVARKID